MDSPVQLGHNPKQVLNETIKLRILCIMFKNFTLYENSNSVFANQNTGKFQWLLETVMEYQPDLRNYKNIKAILESFTSNQNSRLYCALADLNLWYDMGCTYTILQLTSKHIHSIFRRPPYENRPYTRELTYAQRLIMVFQMCNNQMWNKLVNAYAALYRSEFQTVWTDQGKFMLNMAAPFPVPADIFSIICEYHPPAQLMKQNMTASSAEFDEIMATSSTNSPSMLSPVARQGSVLKRRTMSAAVKGQAARAMALAATGKARSMSINNAPTGGFPKYISPSARFNSASAYPDASSWLSAASTPALSQNSQNSQNSIDFSNLLAYSTGPQQLSQAYSAQSVDTLVPMLHSGSNSDSSMFHQLQQASMKTDNPLKYSNPLGLVCGTPAPLATPSNSSDMSITRASEALASLVHTPLTVPKSETQPSGFPFHNFL
ncbi:hypothetical protein GGH97_000451 [Coemansia sp. RSA 475]|nr:hypothetical protein GGH97_000451 [Coemansia sp. RSA 475]